MKLGPSLIIALNCCINCNSSCFAPPPSIHHVVQSILSNKPLSCEDINSVDDAKKELKRIRQLMDNFKPHLAAMNGSKGGAPQSPAKKARNAIHEEERIDDYVKAVVDKSDRIRQLIYDAIKTNVLFENNTEDELTEIIDVFEPCSFGSGENVITQGEKGDDFFVVESGELAIYVQMAGADGVVDEDTEPIKVGNYHDGSAFGELALIYGSPRAATIRATADCRLWRIKRGWYRGVVGQHQKRLHVEKIKFLPNVKVGNKAFRDVLEDDQLNTMAQLLKQEYFRKGDTIIREGEAGNTFYIIQSGDVDVYRKEFGPDPIATLGAEKFFGEKALLKDDVRNATVVASR